MSLFSVAILTYGPYPGLFERCFLSLERYLTCEHVQDLHICCNEIGTQTRLLVEAAARRVRWGGVRTFIHTAPKNACKYPMMRHVLYGPEPARGRYFMWFDDDSMVQKTTEDLFGPVRTLLTYESPVVAKRQGIQLQPLQAEWLNTQPWARKDTPWKPHYLTFPSGGWWAANRGFLVGNNWPIPELYHRGGDVMLGALLEAKGLQLSVPRNMPVWNNCAVPGQHNTQKTRGHNHAPIGSVLPVPPVPVVPIETEEVHK